MSGLINRGTWKSLPLRSSSIFTEIKSFTARTTAMLTYYNDNRVEIEGLFVLPLDHASAIVEFECVIEGHYIFADVNHSSELTNKQVLFENEKMQSGVFNVSVGRIPPWIIVEIQVTLVCEINAMFLGDALRYTLPQTFSPKVVNHKAEQEETSLTAVSTLGYSFQLEILIDAPCLLCGVQSNTHPIQVDAPPLSKTGSKIRVSLPDEFQPIDEVFELLMFLCRPREPYIIIEGPKERKDNDYEKNPISNIMHNPILMLSYSPDITNFSNKLRDTSTNQVGEFLLLVDCTTSMNNHLIDSIRETCILFLKCLPVNCFFNVLRFGSDCDSLFTSSQPYSPANLESALAYVKSLQGYMNTMSLQEPIQWVYNQEKMTHVPQQVFIITTGTMQHSDGVIEYVRKRHHVARCFIFCMGCSGNILYLESISAITHGQCYVIPNNKRPQEQIITCLKAAMQPAVTNLKVSWILPEAYDVIYTPENLPPLFLGDRLNLYAILATKAPETPLNEKLPDSLSSIKEFWFEDFDPFEEYIEKQCSSHDLLTDEPTEINSPAAENMQDTKAIGDADNEVFLTEEEAHQLKNKIGWQKRSSIDKVQTWKISKYPENKDIMADDQDQDCSMYDTERNSFVHRRKKSSSDGIESIGSSNSYSSNMSSSSHLLAFPGYPTRLSSCRSIEARSPRMARLSDESSFSFSEHTKDNYLCAERLNECVIHKSLEKNNQDTKPKERRKLTQALIDDHVNTHLINYSNEDIIARLLEGIVNEKRKKLNEWLLLQEEMTQCTWPLVECEKKFPREKADWRDSGLGNRSSSDTRISDVEDEHDNIGKTGKQEQAEHTRIDEKTRLTSLNLQEKRQDDDTKYTDKSINKKKSKPKQMWNTIIDKVRTLTTVVSQRSGETNFKIKEDQVSNLNKNVTELTTNFNTVTTPDCSNKQQSNCDAQVDKRAVSTEEMHKTDNTKTSLLSAVNRKSDTATTKSKQQYCRNRPLIENSRTISTSSMFEIGQSQIGDIDNLHLLPNHALIYLSGQCGQSSFKRIIPFQLFFNDSKNENTGTGDLMVHQLAAKSIIRDLEIQMDQDEMLINSGKDYVRTLIEEVSKSAHVLSKYTAVVTMDDKCGEDQIISAMMHHETDSSLQTNHPFLANTVPSQLSEKISQLESVPLYEIKSEKADTSEKNKKIWHTKLTLRSPQYGQQFDTKSSQYTVSIQNRLYKQSGYMKIVDLMTSDGCWELTHSLAEALAINYSQLRESCPFADPVLKHRHQKNKHLDLYEYVWATTIALVWLQLYWEEFRDEWILIDRKANQWLSRQRIPKGFILEDVFLLSQQALKILKSSSRTEIFDSE